jgi:photosystem II oxygen-evolving enhancer protein 2
MASASCFLHQTTARFGAAAPRAQLVCKAQKQDEGSAVSRRAALALVAAAVGVKAAPAAAAYGEAGNNT